jgi:hypothetical protein
MNTLPTKYHKMSARTCDIIVIEGARTLNYKILHMYIRYGNIYIYIIYIKLCYISKVGLGTAGFGQLFSQILLLPGGAGSLVFGVPDAMSTLCRQLMLHLQRLQVRR